MIVAHLGAAFIAKYWCMQVPLAIYVFASLFPNILRSVLSIIGLEKEGLRSTLNGAVQKGFSRFFMRARFTHSIISLLAFALCSALVPLLALALVKANNTNREIEQENSVAEQGELGDSARSLPRESGEQSILDEGVLQGDNLNQNIDEVRLEPHQLNLHILRIPCCQLMQIAAALMFCVLSHIVFDLISHGSNAKIYIQPSTSSPKNYPIEPKFVFYRDLPWIVFVVFDYALFFVPFFLFRKAYGLSIHRALDYNLSDRTATEEDDFETNIEAHSNHMSSTVSADATRRNRMTESRRIDEAQTSILVTKIYPLVERCIAQIGLPIEFQAIDMIPFLITVCYILELIFLLGTNTFVSWPVLFSIMRLCNCCLALRLVFVFVDKIPELRKFASLYPSGASSSDGYRVELRSRSQPRGHHTQHDSASDNSSHQLNGGDTYDNDNLGHRTTFSNIRDHDLRGSNEL